jgi:hypothetical protein
LIPEVSRKKSLREIDPGFKRLDRPSFLAPLGGPALALWQSHMAGKRLLTDHRPASFWRRLLG